MSHLYRTFRVAGAIALFSLGIAAVPASAHVVDNNCANSPDNQYCVPDSPPMNATPELDSLLLFGTGLAGVGGYALTRFRARRRQDGADAGSDAA
jgi:hypothetical protein